MGTMIFAKVKTKQTKNRNMKPAIPDHVSKQVNKRARNVKLMALRLLTESKQTKTKERKKTNKNQCRSSVSIIT